MKVRSKWLIGIALTLLVSAAGLSVWFNYDSWTSAADGEAREVAGDSAKHNSHQSGTMQMPGMEMGPNSAEPPEMSDVDGHAVVQISPALLQRLGITVGKVEEAPLEMTVRTVGIVRPDETKEARIHLKTEGWVEKLSVNFTGQQVAKGDPLLAIYSPQFLTTQQEFLTARASAERDKTTAGETRTFMQDAALRRLELWDVPRDAIEELKRTGRPQRTLTLQSPMSGTVLERNVLEGEYVMPSKELYVIADLTTVWVQAKVYEYELPHVALHLPVTVTLPALPDREFEGKVVFIQPVVEEATRTAQVRIELDNREGLLKPGMFAHVAMTHEMGEGLLVPTSAVLRTGELTLAYRADENDRFMPVEVEISPITFEGRYHVVRGLQAGNRIVTSANFLIDSESRLRAGGGSMAGMPGMDMGDMKGMDHSQMKGMEMNSDEAKQGTNHSKMKH